MMSSPTTLFDEGKKTANQQASVGDPMIPIADPAKRHAYQMASMSEVVQGFLKWFRLFSIIFDWASAPLECLIRKRFGLLYMSKFRILMGMCCMHSIGLTMTVGRFASVGKATVFFWLVYFAAWFAAIYHTFVIWRREKNGELWHSMSRGEGWFEKFLPHNLAYLYVEPAVCMAIGLLLYLSGIDKVTGGWVLMCAATIYAKRQIEYAAMRIRVIAIIDAQIEAQVMEEIMKQNDVTKDVSKVDTKGFDPPPGKWLDLMKKSSQHRYNTSVNDVLQNVMHKPGNGIPVATTT